MASGSDRESVEEYMETEEKSGGYSGEWKKVENVARKRARSELDLSIEEDKKNAIVNSDEVNMEVKEVEGKIAAICNDANNKISKKMSGEIVGQASKLSKIIISLLARNMYLQGILDEKDRNIGKMERQIGENYSGKLGPEATYKDVLAGHKRPSVPPITGTRRIPQLIKAAIIKPPEGVKDMDGDKLKGKVMELINPIKERIKVKGVKRIRDGGLKIETATNEDLQKIVTNRALKRIGLTPTPIGANNPRLIIFDVPTELEVVVWKLLQK